MNEIVEHISYYHHCNFKIINSFLLIEVNPNYLNAFLISDGILCVLVTKLSMLKVNFIDNIKKK